MNIGIVVVVLDLMQVLIFHYTVVMDSAKILPFLVYTIAHWSMLMARKKNQLILGNCRTDGLDNTIITLDSEHSINITKTEIIFCVSLHYNQSDSMLIKDSGITAYLFCLDNISKGFTNDN